MIEAKSQIVITSCFEDIAETLRDNFQKATIFSFIKDEFKIEDAKEAMAKAYIASKEQKIIFLAAKRFNIYAQNALLKILEEPPSGVIFILAAPSKTIFLPTILSRLPIHELQGSQQDKKQYFEHFDLETLYMLATKYKKVSKDEAKEIVKQMLEYAMKQDFKLTAKELEYFGRAIKLIELNSNVTNVIITTGLILLTHRKKRQ